MASAGLRSLIGVQTTRHLTIHSTATSGIAVSLRDGSINLSNGWTRQLSETTVGNIQLVLGSESSIAAGWQKKDETTTAAGELKFGTSSIGALAHYTHHFSKKSYGRVAGRVGSTNIEFEIGGGRGISDFSTVRLLYSIGVQGISWKFELHRGGQKLIIPTVVVKPYYRRRERNKKLERMEKSAVQVREARATAGKAQQLLQNVSNRKKNKQLERGGLVISSAVYGSRKAIQIIGEDRELGDELSSQVIDVTVPLNFLVSDSGQLKLHEGIKKSGIMGFRDPSPGEPKQLMVEYIFCGEHYKMVVDDLEELLIPSEMHRI